MDKGLSEIVLGSQHSGYNLVGHEDHNRSAHEKSQIGSKNENDEANRKIHPSSGYEKLLQNTVLPAQHSQNGNVQSLSRGMLTPPTTKNTSNEQNFDLLSTVEKTRRLKGWVIVQILNLGYINMTKSWICNVECMNVLPFTIFVTSDSQAYWALREWKPHLNVVLQKFGNSKSMKFHEDSYNEFMGYRVRIVDSILNTGVAVFLVESDAVWLANPTNFIERYSNVDIVATANNAGQEDKTAMAGFIFLNATSWTRRIWKELRERLDHISAAYHNGTGRTIADMGILNGLIRREGLKIQWLPDDQFFSGQWYRKPELRDIPKQPVVIQNNYIVGNGRKEERAKLWNHWFLSNSTNECIGNPCR
ncbi:uncharacterized protein [Ptychodera flava]|uniref:uncharacterized protein n=1 Tax=Ptychodera flava TaxID=63121 RepID=UPI003969BD68